MEEEFDKITSDRLSPSLNDVENPLNFEFIG
jgi:hypothetical protein